jgi:hypothetical protein
MGFFSRFLAVENWSVEDLRDSIAKKVAASVEDRPTWSDPAKVEAWSARSAERDASITEMRDELARRGIGEMESGAEMVARIKAKFPDFPNK